MQKDIVSSASVQTTNRDISFGLIFFSSNEAPFDDNKYRLVIESARYADAHGFSSVWIPERHFTRDGWLYPNPVVLQAALARETKQIQLRAGSVVMPLHNPIRVAEDWSMVDNLSGGRVGISFASGWHPNDFVLFPENYANRNEMMFRGIETVQKLWRGESIQVQGGDGKLVDIRTYPAPIQRELPIWITAAGNPKTFIGAGEIGANMLTHLYNHNIDELAEKIRLYREARASHGYDPKTGQVSVMIHTFVGETLERVRQQIREPFSTYLKSASYLINAIAYSRGQKVDLASLSEQDISDYLAFITERLITEQRVLFGTPESCYEQVLRMKAAGVTEIACQMDFGIDIDLVLQSMPHLNELKERCRDTQNGYQEDTTLSIATPPVISSQNRENYNYVSTNGVKPQVINELTATQKRCQQEIPVADFYALLHTHGVELGASFQGIERLWRGNNEALGLIQLPETLLAESARYQTHPALLDACFQVLLAALPADIIASNSDALYLPTGLGSFTVHTQPGQHVWSRGIIHGQANANSAVFEGDIYLLDDTGQVLVEAKGLRLQRSEPMEHPTATNKLNELQEWLYTLQWEPRQSFTGKQTTTQAGTWLIFTDNRGVGQELADLITRQSMTRQDGVGQDGSRQGVINDAPTCITVSPGYRYQEMGANQYRINPASADDMRRLFMDALDGDTATLVGVLHLWSLDMTPVAKTSVTSLDADQLLGAGSALNLIQTLLGMKQGPRLWLVTRGAQAVTSSSSASLEVAQSPLWGLGRTCAIEHPELWGGLIDVDTQSDASTTASQLFAILAQQPREDQIAIRDGQSYVARMVRSQEWTPKVLPVRHDATYLITGGLWGLGLEVAYWLARKGARHLVLLGRSELPERIQWESVQAGSRQAQQIAGLRDLERSGVHVHYASVDVANEAQLTALIHNLPQQGFPVIKGIVHAASVWQDARGESLVHPLVNLNTSALQDVFRPKVGGAWLLHSLFVDKPFDFFVSFSSGASLFGSAAQGNYAAAGAFLDALAHSMRANGQPALSIDWGAISETGFGATTEGQRIHEYWESHGIGRITPSHVLAALELLIPQQSAQVGVLKLDWQQLQQFYPQLSQLPLVTHLVETNIPEHTSVATAIPQTGSELQSLVGTSIDRAEQLQRLELYLSERVAAVLRVPEDRLDREQPLTALGLDSLMAIELKNRIERELGVHISIVAFLQGPSIRQFATQLLEQLPLATTAPSTEVAQENDMLIDQQRAEQLLTQLDILSDADVESLLGTMLQQERGATTEKENGNGHHKTTGNVNQMSKQDATQSLAQLDQLSDEDVETLLSQITQEGD